MNNAITAAVVATLTATGNAAHLISAIEAANLAAGGNAETLRAVELQVRVRFPSTGWIKARPGSFLRM